MEKKNVLLVEGYGDRSVVKALMQHYRLPYIVEFGGCEGGDKLKKECEQILKNPTAYRRVGVIVDADENAGSSWQRYRDLLLKTGRYDCSKMELSADGLIVEPIDKDLDPIFGLWVMPDNQSKGALEDFLLQMVSRDDELMNKVVEVLKNLEAENKNRYRPVDRNKAKLNTFLAWEKRPGHSFETEIKAGVLLPEASGITDLFVQWLKHLLED